VTAAFKVTQTLNGMTATTFNGNSATKQAYLEAIADETSADINDLCCAIASDTSSSLNSLSRRALQASSTQVSFDVSLQTVVAHGGTTNQINTDITSFKTDLNTKTSGGQLVTKMKEKSTEFNSVSVESPVYASSTITADSPAPTPLPTILLGSSSKSGSGSGGGGDMFIYAGAGGGAILIAISVGIWYYFNKTKVIGKKGTSKATDTSKPNEQTQEVFEVYIADPSAPDGDGTQVKAVSLDNEP